jgi:hypothetical protein
MNNEHAVIKFIEIRYADPICSIDLTEKGLLLGSMMGRAIYYSIPDKKYFLLSETQQEHISGVQFKTNSNDIFYIAIGDESVQTYTKNENGMPQPETTNNYESESEHTTKCNSCFTLLSNIYLMRIFLHLPSDDNTDVCSMLTDYIITNVDTKNSISGQVEMSNYAVPFDTDGQRFMWIDFLSENERTICVYNFREDKFALKYTLDKSFGHVSHMKFLPNGKIFLVRNYNMCEIRKDDTFDTERTFMHIGSEVIACDFLMNNCNSSSLKENKEVNGVICTLDINGNVNLYQYKNDKIDMLFNMFRLSDIKQEDKDRQFFSMGYPYYVKISGNYIAVTTDYGCYLIHR